MKLLLAIPLTFCVLSSLFCLYYMNELAERINQTLSHVLEAKQDVLLLSKNEEDIWRVLNYMAEDYPPKKSVSERLTR